MLTGKLTRLRPLDVADLDRYLEWINDPEVVQFLGGTLPLVSRLAETDWLERTARKDVAYGDVTLAIETLEGRHIGSIALHNPKQRDRHCSLGIMIGDKEYWSRGYGTDAIRTLLRLAFDEMNLNRVWLTVDEDNARGIACYRKCGFIEEARLRQDRYCAGRYHDTLIMGVLASEFRAIETAGPPT
jgi:RimJ/RimL family protein N-acetyltransferase